MATQAFLLQRFNPQIPLQRPLSPALSNPDLILPDSEPSSEYPRYVERPPSPSQIIRKVQSQGRIASNNNRAIGGHLAKNYYGGTTKRLNWQVQEPQVLQIDAHVRAHEVRTPPLSRKSSNLEDIDELDATPTRADYDRHIPDEVLASSPTLKQITPLDRLTPDWNPPKLERKWSDASSSVHSDDFESLESLKWPGFDGPAGEDGDADEGSVMLDGEEEDSFGSFPEKRESDGDGDQEKFEGAKTGNENDPYSPDALSRRADVILANAKRRLNAFEGNLRGARHSLPISQSMSMVSLRSPPDLPPLPTPPRERKKRSRLSGFAGPQPVGTHAVGDLKRHSRGLSDASASSFIQELMAARAARGEPPRAVSALERHTVANQLRSSRSTEVMKENRVRTWINGAQASLESLASPVSPAFTRPSRGRHSIRRSPSTTNDLRTQMNELKGKISNLQQRAREDTLKRRSISSTRSQSPFTDPELSYQTVDIYGNGTISSGVHRSTPNVHHYAVNGVNGVNGSGHYATDMPEDYDESDYESAEEPSNELDRGSPEPEAMMGASFPDYSEDNPYETADDDSVYDSVIFEDAPSHPAERHEDRPDAFDYENFFLHSAMGSYTRGDRSSSVSSNSSVETTKPSPPPKTSITSPVDPAPEPDEEAVDNEVDEDIDFLAPGALHKRSASSASISTIATFMTATEGGDEEEDDFDPLDMALAALPSPQSTAYQLSLPLPSNSPGLRDSAVAMSPTTDKRPTSSGVDSTGSARRIGPSPLSLGSQSPSLSDMLSPSSSDDSNRTHESVLMLSPSSISVAGTSVVLKEQDHALVLELAKSLEKVCLALRDSETGQYEGKIWRRRLDDARRALDGVEEVMLNGNATTKDGEKS